MKKGNQLELNLLNFMCKLREASVSRIGSWDWNVKGDNSIYHALYPRAWTIYEGNLHYIAVSKSNCCNNHCEYFFLLSYLIITF